MDMITKEEILTKLGLDVLDEENQLKALKNIAKVVSETLLNQISDKLDEEDLDKLDELIRDKKDDEVDKLIRSKFPNYDEFAIKVEREVIDSMAEDRKTIEEAYNKLKQEDSSNLDTATN